MATYPNTGLAQDLAPWFGSCKIEVSEDSGSTWINVGLARGVVFNEVFEQADIQADNGPDLKNYVSDHEVEIQFSALEFYLPTLNKLRGGIDTLTTVAGAATTAADSYTTGETSADLVYFLANQGASDTLAAVSKVVQADTGGGLTTLTADDDYVIMKNANNDVGVVFINAAGSSYKSSESAVITYVYGAIASYKLSSGGFSTITPKMIRLTNLEYVSGVAKYRYITLYSVSLMAGLNLAFKSANESDPVLEIPIQMKARLDTSRTAGDQLYLIEDQKATA